MAKTFEKKHSFFDDSEPEVKEEPETKAEEPKKKAPAKKVKTKKAEPKSKTRIAVVKTEVPEGYKLAPEYVEIKSKRVQLVLQPSVHDLAKQIVVEEGISLNEYVHRLIVEDARKRGKIE